MTYKEAIETIKIAIAEVEWNYPMDYAIAFDKAIEAMRMQIPIKPVGKHTQMRCGFCGTRIRSGNGSSSFTRDTVCRKCHTVIDWSEEYD